METKTQKMKNLIAQIKQHDYNYYILNAPTISDYEYDKLEAELKKLEDETGVILPESTTNKMRVEKSYMQNTKFKKHRHIKRLFSLQKCNTKEELAEFLKDLKEKFNSCNFILQYKFDGFNLCLTYKNGKLHRAATRGDGEVGELITEQVKTIKNIPHEIKYKGVVEIQGECIMKKSVFNAFNKTSSEKLVNERNAAAGAVRNLDPNVTKSRNLDAVFYTINFIENDNIKTEEDVHNFFVQNKIPCSDFNKIFSSIGSLISEVENIGKNKNLLDFQIDGMVVRLNNIAQQRALGCTNKFPRALMAYKFEAEEQTTKLADVVWQVGRTGKLTPIAILDEVFLAGAKIKRATLNNAGDILRKKVKIGSTVLIRRSNEVIPEVLGVYETPKNAKEIKTPSHCPECSAKLVENGANIFCVNPKCPAILKDKLIHFCSKKAFNIEGISEKTVEDFFNILGVAQVYEIFDLKEEDLAPIFKQSGIDSKQAKNIAEQIEKSKNIELNKFIYSLSISGVGEKSAKTLANKFGSLNALMAATEEDLTLIKDIGPIVAKNIVLFFNDENNKKIISSLFERGVMPGNVKLNLTNKLEGKTFVITGTFENYSRDALSELIEKNGGKTSSSVSKKTDFVVFGESAGSKLKKAKELGVKTLNLQELLYKID